MAVTQIKGPGEANERADQRVRLHDVPWSHYEILLAVRSDAPVPRIAYLEGELELMSPSLDHEMIKSRIRQLVEAYAAHRAIDLWPIGSWTIRSAPAKRGAEPDECYTVGDPRTKSVPDLAIEVVWTSGGIDKLEIYRGLGVGEVWFWREGRIDVHVLRDGRYHASDVSVLLPGLDVSLVARLATASPTEALAELRKSLT
ncbi:MAG: Uma2 family endonuclease [Deltaproteobacteria bacterium]|nr:Uma2 family endonuclease [Deltaproteobacteria bacterium]MDQ3299250.1 Uma2 family endonuclease [Myxococcota bacterium]